MLLRWRRAYEILKAWNWIERAGCLSFERSKNDYFQATYIRNQTELFEAPFIDFLLPGSLESCKNMHFISWKREISSVSRSAASIAALVAMVCHVGKEETLYFPKIFIYKSIWESTTLLMQNIRLNEGSSENVAPKKSKLYVNFFYLKSEY